MKKPLLLAALLMVAGCASPPPKFQVSIESDPPGARIEVNNEYIGVTPLKWSTGGNGDRSFNGSWVQGSQIVFVATPPRDVPGLSKQEKRFTPSAFFKQGDHIPEKMLFDLHAPPQ